MRVAWVVPEWTTGALGLPRPTIVYDTFWSTSMLPTMADQPATPWSRSVTTNDCCPCNVPPGTRVRR